MWWLCAALAVCVRQFVSLHPYSGEGDGPRFGDYEAHRHWMEITNALPASEWYSYDLDYWGLDYPPVMAYVEWIFGRLSSVYEPASIAFESSRGYETLSHRRFMRATVLLCDFVFIAVMPQEALLSPAPILVDHGHFQYNCLPLGLACWTAKLIENRPLAAAACFCVALNTKQTALYYAPAVFFEFLARARSLKDVAKVAAVVVATFAVVWAPIFSTQALRRCFPVERGIFEDKVANAWYVAQVLFRVRDTWRTAVLVKAAAVATALAAFPVPIARCFKRAKDADGFLLSLHLSGLAFFLFSFHVHEKAILVPLAPLLLVQKESLYRDLFSFAAAVSISPLLFFEGLGIAYVATLVIFVSLLKERRRRKLFAQLLIVVVLLSCLPKFVQPPARFPDLYPALTAIFFAGIYTLAFALMTVIQLRRLSRRSRNNMPPSSNPYWAARPKKTN